MNQSTWAFLVLLGATMIATAGEPQAETILARGSWTHLPTHSSAGIGTEQGHHLWVLRSETELLKVAGQSAPMTVAKVFKVEAIDFKKQMLVVIEDGTQPLVGVSGGGPPSALYAVAVHRVDRDDTAKTITIHWRLVPRGKDQEVLTRPLEAVLLDRIDAEVKFNKLAPADKPLKEPEISGRVVTPVARAFWPDGWKPEALRQEWFVRDYAALIDPRLAAPETVLERMRVEALARYTKALRVDSIDFAKHMIIGVSGGVQPTGSRVEITRVERDDSGKGVTVFWRLHRPKKDSIAKDIAHVAEVILVKRSTDTIKFQKDDAKKD